MRSLFESCACGDGNGEAGTWTCRRARRHQLTTLDVLDERRLRKAHRARSRMLHPDLHPNGVDEGLPTIHDVNVAYECLKTLLV